MKNKKSRSETASISLRKVIIVSIICIFLLGISVIAGNTKINSIKIRFANNHEITVITSDTKVSDILKESNIELAIDEVTIPDLNENINNTKTIKIVNIANLDKETIASKETTETNLENIEKNYENITEEIKTQREEIPFETITKDVSNGGSDTINRILQNGKNGIREVTYKIKYQNDIEIERIELYSKIIKEPRNKIVQTQTTSSRSSSARTASTSSISGASGMYRITAYCPCVRCCGKTDGITASGVKATANNTIAAPSTFKFGTKVLINGVTYTVEDRGGAIQGNRIDVYMDSHQEAINWGSQYLYLEVLN